ncbi:hypothetical protein [Capnocytophaga cynodegmi]|uniref:Roadblock/LAMTOR2 domain-containing protein n=1 Tax=Capnocytophaga cynodegmi TaxID=28189 RepID=A0A0B7H4H5_9FLAO|nr:hypothetical protein [Capnocytophaga cynodegmi]CEN33444.1 conserved hypothetical protein [Capnocytophaga cynodegmi]
MNALELQKMLNDHCQEMKDNMPGFLFYGILSSSDGTTLSKAQANDNPLADRSAFHLTILNQVKMVVDSNAEANLEIDDIIIETNKIVFIIMVSALGKFFSVTALEREHSNLGITRALLYRCKAEFGTMLDDYFE